MTSITLSWMNKFRKLLKDKRLNHEDVIFLFMQYGIEEEKRIEERFKKKC